MFLNKSITETIHPSVKLIFYVANISISDFGFLISDYLIQDFLQSAIQIPQSAICKKVTGYTFLN